MIGTNPWYEIPAYARKNMHQFSEENRKQAALYYQRVSQACEKVDISEDKGKVATTVLVRVVKWLRRAI